MISILAQIPSADALRDWLMVLFFLLGGAVAVKKLFQRDPGALPNPIKVQAEEKFAEATALAAVKDDLEALAIQVREGFTQLNSERRSSVANLHTKVDAVASSTAGLEGQLKLLNQQVQQLVIHQLSQGKK